jgi:aminoglycoside phosphotransferase (APT) family kinase protein
LQRWATFPQAIGIFLATIHATPLDLIRYVVHEEPFAMADWLEDARTTFAEVQGEIPLSLWPRIEAFLAAPTPAEEYTPTLVHNDLGIEHILVDPASRRITGIIDWGDAAIADPAYDFGKLFRDLGPATLEAVLPHYHATANNPDAIRERAIFYGRCTVFEDLAYGLQAGHEAYLQKSLALLDQLFD